MGVAGIEVQSPSLAITLWHHWSGERRQGDCVFGPGERVAPLGSLSSMTRGASRDSRRRIRPAIWKKLSRQRYSRGSGLSFPACLPVFCIHRRLILLKRFPQNRNHRAVERH